MEIKRILGVLSMMLSLNACASSWIELDVMVHDENSNPVEGAEVRGLFFDDVLLRKKNRDSHRAVTDSSGQATVAGKEEIYIDIVINKPDYYESRKRYSVRGKASKSLDFLLRPKRNSIPMYAKNVIGMIPGYDEKSQVQKLEIGYDLIAGDYVTPYGRGQVSDLKFYSVSNRRSQDDFEFTRLVTFSNDLDGLIPYYFSYKNSKYKDIYLAPQDGYRKEWLQEFSRKPQKADTGNLDRSRNYYFRVRTVINEQGGIQSAYYGKIHGDFPHFTYYLNPTPNDRNIEFDPKQNLFKKLKSGEHVSQP